MADDEDRQDRDLPARADRPADRRSDRRARRRELLDGDRLSDLFEISIDEAASRKGHRYLTLVGDYRRRCVV